MNGLIGSLPGSLNFENQHLETCLFGGISARVEAGYIRITFMIFGFEF